MKKSLLLLAASLLLFACTPKIDNSPRRLEILFVGHQSKHHNSEQLAEILSKEYFKAGINISYTNNPDYLAQKDLKLYDGLILYANHDSITKEQEKGLLDFVESGKGFIPIHSASWCFRNSPDFIELVGGQFKSHGVDSFSTEIIKPNHPALKDVKAFSTWDETYVHDKISDSINVLMERVENGHREPYTWVRNYGDGRVFYTAFGHDDRTFRNPGFLQLIKSGIFWAVGDEAMARLEKFKLAEPEYKSGYKMPNYERRDPAPLYQLPLNPEESMSQIQVPVGFKLELFVAEPDIMNPIAMSWDEKGRLWVIETVDYPNTVIDTPGVGDDRIKICEDTNGDGRADKFTVFADNLNIPTSIVFANGGIIVSQAPHFLFLKDTNGDDKADVRETLFTGWGTFDTHAGPSNLHYAMDNRIWGTVGYSGFDGTMAGKKRKFGSGIYAFAPNGKTFEFLAPTTNNTWGLGFSEEFDVFVSTANNEHSDHYAIPNRLYDIGGLKEKGIEKIDGHYAMHVVTKNLRQVDVQGGFTAATGHNLYTARAFPQEYWNRIAFVCEPTGRVIHKAILEPDGSGFNEKDGWNFVASADEWFGPVQTQIGPDGALWVLDWYNFIIQHNPTPQGFETGKGNAYVDPLREKKRGRIYRVVYENAPDYEPLQLDKDDSDGLLDALENKNMFWRMTAQRLLVESGNTDVADKLYALVQDESMDEIGINAPATHALWTLHGLGLLDGANPKAIEVATAALSHPAAGVRKAALQVLPKTATTLEAILATNILYDEDPRVRLTAILALAEMPASTAAGINLYDVAQRAENAQDKWISHAVLIATKVHRTGFMQEYEAKQGSTDYASADGSLISRIAAGDRMQVLPFSKWTTIRSGDIPDISGNEINITAKVTLAENGKSKGVILAYGNQNNGLALYMLDGKLYFQVNRDNEEHILSTSTDLLQDFILKAEINKNAVMSLSINDKSMGQKSIGKLFASKLLGEITSGFDRKEDGKAGNYADDFNFNAYIDNAKITFFDVGMQGKDQAKIDQVITINTIVNQMKYDKESITVKAGSTVKIVFTNPDHMQHNLLILKPGSFEKVGTAADKLAQDPQGASNNYIPQLAEVLFSIPLVNPQSKYELIFKVPDTPGDYPYVCTFPGHWRIMNGVMKVVR